MPDSSAQRRDPRHPLVLSTLYKVTGPGPAKVGVGWTRNLSEGGACLELGESLPPATALDVLLQTDKGTLGLEAEVVWVGGPAAAGSEVLHGVAFTEVSPAQLQALRELMSRKGEIRQAAVRVPVKLDVQCRPKGEAGSLFAGQTGDMSREGLSLRLPHPLPAGTAVDVILPTPRETLTVEATVVWVEPPETQRPGEPIHHGLRFTTLSWANELTLGLLLAEVPDGVGPPSEKDPS